MNREKLRASLQEVDRKIRAAVERIGDQERRIEKIPPSRADWAPARELLMLMNDALKALKVFRQALINALAFTPILRSPQHDAVRHGRARPQGGNNRAVVLRTMNGRLPRLRARISADKRCMLVNAGAAWSRAGPPRLQNYSLTGAPRPIGRGHPCPRR